jgi:hypothetical protein
MSKLINIAIILGIIGIIGCGIAICFISTEENNRKDLCKSAIEAIYNGKNINKPTLIKYCL